MSGCAHTVDVNFNTSDRCVLIEARTPKALKMHTCFECNRIIHKGEEYRREILKHGSKMFHHKYCEDCLSVREVFFSSGWLYGELWEQMTDFIGDVDGRISEYQLTQLTKDARDKVLDMMEEYWNE